MKKNLINLPLVTLLFSHWQTKCQLIIRSYLSIDYIVLVQNTDQITNGLSLGRKNWYHTLLFSFTRCHCGLYSTNYFPSSSPSKPIFSSSILRPYLHKFQRCRCQHSQYSRHAVTIFIEIICRDHLHHTSMKLSSLLCMKYRSLMQLEWKSNLCIRICNFDDWLFYSILIHSLLCKCPHWRPTSS